MAFKFGDDHWAFLDDIEAPMWADLSLEANSNVHDIDDDKWFYTTHPFHQCSSSHLKSVFSRGGDESTSLDSDLLGPSLPKLPHSVSKSRGKQYRTKKWKGDSFGKGHPVEVLTGKSSRVKLGPANKVKHKSSSANLDQSHTSKSTVVCESSSSGGAVSCSSKLLSSCENPGSRLSSEANKTSESNPTSTVTTSDSVREQIKVVDGLSSDAFGQTNELLSMMKKCLRKSNITRQVMRVEVNNDGKQSRAWSSTSSKSSVGSSSNPQLDIRVSTSILVRSKEITPDSRNVARMGSVKAPPTMKAEEGASNNRRVQVNTAKPACKETANQKVQYQDSRAKALGPSRVNGPKTALASSELKKKTGLGLSRNLAGVGKENVFGRTSVTQEKCGVGKENVFGRTSVTQKKCSVSGVGVGDRIADGDKKMIKQSLSGRSNATGKGRGLGNSEKLKNLVQRPHFR